MIPSNPVYLRILSIKYFFSGKKHEGGDVVFLKFPGLSKFRAYSLCWQGFLWLIETF
jgi:hypothetical protein